MVEHIVATSNVGPGIVGDCAFLSRRRPGLTEPVQGWRLLNVLATGPQKQDPADIAENWMKQQGLI